MKNVTRTSSQKDSRLAVQDISEGIENPRLVLFFAPETIFRETAEEISRRFPSSKSMGTTSRHTYDTTGFHTDEVTATYFFDDIECSGDFIPEINTFPLKYAQRIQAAISRLSSTENTICLSFTTAYSNSEELVATALDTVCSENGITVAGGTSGTAGSEDKGTMVSLDGKVYEDSTVFMCIKNLTGKIRVFKENVYIPTDKRFTATSVDIKNRIVRELDKKPATEALEEALGCPSSELKKHLEKQPIGRITDNEIYISAIEKILPDKSTKWSSRIYNNTKVSLLELGDYRTIAGQTAKRIEKLMPEPSLVFLIHCDARTDLYERLGYIDGFTETYSSKFKSLSGFSSHGEQLGKIHFNLTLLAIVFE